MKYKLAKLNDCGADLSKRWYVYYSFVHPETGKMHLFKKFLSQRLMTKKSRYEKAQQWIREINIKLQNGWDPFRASEKHLNVNEAITSIVEIKTKMLRRRSRITMNSFLRIFRSFLEIKNYQSMPVEEFSYYHAQEFMDWVMTERTVNKRTYNNYLGCMRTIFNYLLERDLIMVNPFNKVKMVKEEEPKIMFFTDEEREKMRNILPQIDYPLYLASQLIFYCFLRPQELVCLKIKDFDLKKKIIIIPPEVSKNKKQQVVTIPDCLVEELKIAGIREFPSDFYLFSKDLLPGKVTIFPTRMAERWLKARKQLGIDKGLYHLKHTGVGMAVESGISLRDIQLQCRHHSLDMTQAYINKFSQTPSEKFTKLFPKF